MTLKSSNFFVQNIWYYFSFQVLILNDVNICPNSILMFRLLLVYFIFAVDFMFYQIHFFHKYLAGIHMNEYKEKENKSTTGVHTQTYRTHRNIRTNATWPECRLFFFQRLNNDSGISMRHQTHDLANKKVYGHTLAIRAISDISTWIKIDDCRTEELRP